MLEHPAVGDVAVVGIKVSEEVGELPRAYIVINPSHPSPVTDEAIASHLKGRLANYKELAGGVRRLDVIPRNASGKILRKVLREMAKKESTTNEEMKDASVTTDSRVGFVRSVWNWIMGNILRG